MSVSFEVKADKAIKRFRETLKRAENPKTVMDVLSVESWKHVIDHFSAEEGKKGRWKEWSPQYAKYRKGTKILQDTGTLRSSIRFRSIRDEAHVYTKQSYARVHQDGGKNMPKRDFLWMSKPMIKRLSKIFIHYISRGKK